MKVPVSPLLFCRDIQALLGPPAEKLLLRQPRLFSTTQSVASNRILDPIRILPTFHDCLRSSSASNTFLLALFTTSACTPCRMITPFLQDLVKQRSPKPEDTFSSIAFTEVELDSPDQSNGNMMGLGVEYGITTLPTLAGFGGRRAERLTARIVDVKMMGDGLRMGQWIDEEMKKGDPFGTSGGGGGEGLFGLFGKLFGSKS